MYKDLMAATQKHEDALNSASLNIHAQFPGRDLIKILTDGIKVGAACVCKEVLCLPGGAVTMCHTLCVAAPGPMPNDQHHM